MFLQDDCDQGHLDSWVVDTSKETLERDDVWSDRRMRGRADRRRRDEDRSDCVPVSFLTGKGPYGHSPFHDCILLRHPSFSQVVGKQDQ